MNKTTRIEPRSDWYGKGDNVSMVVDEGSSNEAPIRKAQLKVIEIELDNIKIMLAGKDPSGHEFPSGPYLWTVHLFAPDEIKSETIAQEEGDDPHIAGCGGGDSAGFGYNWRFDVKNNVIYMTEDPSGSRTPVG